MSRRIMTKKQHQKYARLIEKRSRITGDIYKIVNGSNLPFKQCYVRAPPELQQQYREAELAYQDFEYAMVAEKRAWFDINGAFHPHY